MRSFWEAPQSFRLPSLPCLWSWQCTCVFSNSVCLTLCDPMDCSPPGSSVHGIFFLRQEYWGDLPCSPMSLPPRDRTTSPVSPALASEFFTSWATGKLCLTYFQYRYLHGLFLCYTWPIHLNSSCWKRSEITVIKSVCVYVCVFSLSEYSLLDY